MRPRASDFWLSAAHTRALLDQPPLSVTGLSYADVEEDISALENVLSLIKRNRNSRYAPVSRLPLELLVLLFSFVRDEDTLARTRDGWALYMERCRRIGCMAITHTCHHWREVALASPALWTDVFIPPKSRTWGTEILARSAAMPLCVDVYLENKEAEELESYLPEFLSSTAISNCHSRIRELRLSEHMNNFPLNRDDVVSLLSKPMPILESASLQVFAGRDPFSPGILSQAPRLTKLSVLDFYISWDASIFSQLTELELVFNTNVRPPITVAGMNALFQRTALLEHLLIEEMFPVDIEVVHGAPAPSSAVHVPVSLSQLHVKAINSFADELIFSTSIVRAEHTRLTVDARRCVAEDLPNVKRCLARHAGSKPPKALAIFLETPWMEDGAYSYGPAGISIGVWHTLSDQLFETSSAPVDVTVQWSIRTAEPDEVEHLPIFPSLIDYGLPVQDIVDVSLNFEFGLSLDNYTVLFQQMIRVQRLRITERTAVDLFAEFAPVVRTILSSTSSDASDTQPPPLFGLSKLYIVDDSSNWTVPPDYAKGQTWTPNLDYGPVVECIRLRKASGRPLEELHIPRKYEGESWVEQVRVLVGVVGWSKPEWL